MNQKQLVVMTLKDLAQECLREQMRLKTVVRDKNILEGREKVLRHNIKVLKMRVNRELIAHKDLLGVGVIFEDNEGEEWKQPA